MKTKKLMAALLTAGVCISAQAGTLLTEGFGNVAGLAGAGWAQSSSGTGAGSGWFQGNPGVFPSSSGAANAYAAANFVDTGGSISDWLFTPTLALAGGATLNFDLRLLGDGFLDTVEVWLSGNGASTNLADFTRVATFSSASDTGWQSQALSIYSLTSGRIGFRYFVGNTATDGNYAGIDSVSVVPEPGTLALMSLALGGLVMVRRQRA